MIYLFKEVIIKVYRPVQDHPTYYNIYHRNIQQVLYYCHAGLLIHVKSVQPASLVANHNFFYENETFPHLYSVFSMASIILICKCNMKINMENMIFMEKFIVNNKSSEHDEKTIYK